MVQIPYMEPDARYRYNAARNRAVKEKKDKERNRSIQALTLMLQEKHRKERIEEANRDREDRQLHQSDLAEAARKQQGEMENLRHKHALERLNLDLYGPDVPQGGAGAPAPPNAGAGGGERSIWDQPFDAATEAFLGGDRSKQASGGAPAAGGVAPAETRGPGGRRKTRAEQSWEWQQGVLGQIKEKGEAAKAMKQAEKEKTLTDEGRQLRKMAHDANLSPEKFRAELMSSPLMAGRPQFLAATLQTYSNEYMAKKNEVRKAVRLRIIDGITKEGWNIQQVTDELSRHRDDVTRSDIQDLTGMVTARDVQKQKERQYTQEVEDAKLKKEAAEDDKVAEMWKAYDPGLKDKNEIQFHGDYTQPSHIQSFKSGTEVEVNDLNDADDARLFSGFLSDSHRYWVKKKGMREQRWKQEMWEKFGNQIRDGIEPDAADRYDFEAQVANLLWKSYLTGEPLKNSSGGWTNWAVTSRKKRQLYLDATGLEGKVVSAKQAMTFPVKKLQDAREGSWFDELLDFSNTNVMGSKEYGLTRTRLDKFLKTWKK